MCGISERHRDPAKLTPRATSISGSGRTALPTPAADVSICLGSERKIFTDGEPMASMRRRPLANAHGQEPLHIDLDSAISQLSSLAPTLWWRASR